MALITPAGPVDDVMIATGLRRCRELGFEPVPGASIRSRLGYLAGTDDERAADLQHAIEGDCVAIWALRGGYGTLRTLQHVDLQPLVDRPKPFIGFSDNTVIHLALHRLGVTSYHGPHAGYPFFPDTTAQVFRAVVMGRQAPGRLPLPDGASPRALVPGTAEGPLVGGNLAMLAAACGTPYQPDARGAILFLEDVGEPLYRIDRMLTQLRLAGVLEGVAGVALGAFTPPEDEAADPPPDPDEASDPPRDLADVLLDVLGPLGVPMVLGLPIGHEHENWTLPLGVRARLVEDPVGLHILEPSTRA